jgi:hypothetical protein
MGLPLCSTAQPLLSDIPANDFLKSLEETIKMVENTLYYEDRNKSYLLVVTENVYRLLPPNDWAVLCHYKNMYLHIVSAADLPNQYSAYFMQVP